MNRFHKDHTIGPTAQIASSFHCTDFGVVVELHRTALGSGFGSMASGMVLLVGGQGIDSLRGRCIVADRTVHREYKKALGLGPDLADSLDIARLPARKCLVHLANPAAEDFAASGGCSGHWIGHGRHYHGRRTGSRCDLGLKNCFRTC